MEEFLVLLKLLIEAIDLPRDFLDGLIDRIPVEIGKFVDLLHGDSWEEEEKDKEEKEDDSEDEEEDWAHQEQIEGVFLDPQSPLDEEELRPYPPPIREGFWPGHIIGFVS